MENNDHSSITIFWAQGPSTFPPFIFILGLFIYISINPLTF